MANKDNEQMDPANAYGCWQNIPQYGLVCNDSSWKHAHAAGGIFTENV